MTTTSTAATAPTITFHSPADLVVGVPYLLGFHPDDSLVVVALAGRSVACTARADLDPAAPEALAGDLIRAIGLSHPTAVAVLGYGAPARVDPAVAAVRAFAERRGLPVRDALRVHEGRWWSYVCDNPRCCPPEGTPFDPRSSDVAASFTVAGMPVLPDRSALAAQVAPLTGPARAAMTAATDRAWARLSRQLGAVPDDQAAALVVAEGTTAVDTAIARYAAGGQLDDDEVAWLCVLLQSLTVRDGAWLAIRSEQPHRRLWLDITRRADPELVPAPASLLAFTAYRAGDGPLAGMALRRALTEDASYSMAQLLAQALVQGLPPSTFDDWGAVGWPDSDAPTCGCEASGDDRCEANGAGRGEVCGGAGGSASGDR